MANGSAHDVAVPAGQRTVRAAGRQLLGSMGSPQPGDARRRHSLDSLQVREHGGTNAAAFELLQAIRSEAASQPPWARDDRKVSDGAVVVRRPSRGTSTPQSRPRNSRGEIDLESSRVEGRRKESPAGNQGRLAPGQQEIARGAGRAAARQRSQAQEQSERWGVAPPWSSQAAARGAVPSQRLPSKGTPIRNPAKPDLGPIAAMWRTACEPNSAFRSHMEDSSVVIDPYLAGDGDTWAYFAVYDGHGGRQAVDYVEAKLHGIILEELKAAIAAAEDRLTDQAVSDSMSKAFYRVDEQLKPLGTWRCGCTATVVLAHRSAGSLRLHVANVGDSRSIAIDAANSEWRISRDHRPNDPAEIQRVESEGGFVTRGRVAGQLGVSRALGDHSLKSVGVTWRPSVCARDATQDTALVIGSDGLWDAMSDADVRVVVERAMSEKAHEKAADMLVREAWRAGSTDNITSLVAFFGKMTSQGVGRPRTGGA